MKQPLGIFLILILLSPTVITVPPSHGEVVSQGPNDRVIKIDVDLTLVNATVIDRQNHYVPELSAHNFKLWENKVQQKIEYFSAEDIPMSLGLILDISGSMAGVSLLAREAAVNFMKESNRDDEYFLVEFNQRTIVAEDFTTDARRLEDRVRSVQSTGSTSLYDAVHVALERLHHGSRPRKALLLISDGEDNSSQYRFSDIKQFAREQDVPIYAIGLVPSKQPPSRMFHRSGQEVLEDLSDVTGGRAFFTDSGRDLEEICRRAAEDMRHQYLIGYKSTNAIRDGKWRKIQMRVMPPPGPSHMTIHAKPGYYAPKR